jgi:regulator of sigma E protease
MITTVLAFLVTLGVLIIVHEYGHYRVAVACGVKVLRFSVGFGRPLLRWQRGPTEFVVCALPLGGYVRMLDEREGGVEAGERDQAFNRKPLRQRTAIVAAGPLANLGLAVLLLAASHWIGVDEPKAVLGTPAAGSLAQAADLRAGDWVRAVATADGEWEEVESLTDLRWRVTRAALDGRDLQLMLSDRAGHGSRTATLPLHQLPSRDVDAEALRRIGLGAAYSEPVLGDLQPGGPAAQAGLAKGDRVLAINGEPVGDAQSLRDRIRAAVVGGQAQRLLWRIERAGSVREIEVQPRLVDDNGQPRGRIDAYVGGAPEMVTVRRGPIDGVVQGTERTWEIATLTVRMIGRMLIGEASVKNLSGPLTIADAAGQSAERGLAYYLGFLALVSVSLGVLNLLPLPMLDGGHLMYYLFEGVTGRPVSEIWLARLQRGGIAVLLVMMSVALFNDVARLLGLH